MCFGNVCFSRPLVPQSGAESAAQAGSADMLPKVETESLGLSRSYGEQGHMPRNMQGKNCHTVPKALPAVAPSSPSCRTGSSRCAAYFHFVKTEHTDIHKMFADITDQERGNVNTNI